MSFESQLKAARIKTKMTQQQVADALGINKTTYSGYETGKREPDVFKIKALAKLFGVSGDDLLEISNDSINTSKNEPINDYEQEHIKKYRSLDESGKETVDVILETQYKRCNPSAGNE